MNLFRYCGDDPVDRSDPTGLYDRNTSLLVSSGGGDWNWFNGGVAADQLDWLQKERQLQLTIATVAENSAGALKHGDGYGSSALEAGLTRLEDANKIARADTEGVAEIGREKTNPRQFYATVAHEGNKGSSNFRDGVKTDNGQVATSVVDPAHLPKNYELVGAVLAHRYFTSSRAAQDIQRAKNHHWQTFIVTGPQRKSPVIYDKDTNPNPSY